MSGKQRSGIFDPGSALDSRFEQVSQLSRYIDGHSKNQGEHKRILQVMVRLHSRRRCIEAELLLKKPNARQCGNNCCRVVEQNDGNSSEPIVDAIAPSQVFAGLMRSADLCFPIARPT